MKFFTVDDLERIYKEAKDRNYPEPSVMLAMTHLQTNKLIEAAHQAGLIALATAVEDRAEEHCNDIRDSDALDDDR